ncbi:MAG: nucleoside triphosphate pyrophosphohydrolase [Clostridia bacterium]|nr:nucleoside triphosphate pyrophosphohydrolase [Clostridia bacterium]
MVDFKQKEKYDINDLLEIMRSLRAPGGCPWDAEQTHESIRKNLIEETYEVVEAIDKKDSDMLLEELGDLLMQVVFHAQMEDEKGVFNFDDVADGVCKKLIERHPHVFGEIEVSGVGDVLDNWDAIKRRKKGQKKGSEPMLSVPRELPALMRAAKIQQKASAVGFDWPDVSGAYDKIIEETQELRKAVESGVQDDVIEELGDLLFSVVNVSRFLKCDAEEALTAASDKFINRFIRVEQLAKENGVDMEKASLEELDRLWNIVKSHDK